MSLDDKYTYPGSNGVLRNKLGLTTKAALDKAMNQYASAVLAGLSTDSQSVFDRAYLEHIHRRMFGRLFVWAGTARDVDTGAGQTGIVYARPQFIEENIEAFFAGLQREDFLLGASSVGDFTTKLAGHWGTLTQLHPFRDGNTRSQSLFVSNLAEAAGYPLDWRLLDVNKLRIARLRAVQGDESPLTNLLQAAATGGVSRLIGSIVVFAGDDGGSQGVAITVPAPVPANRCGKPRANGKGFCMRRVGDHGCPYHG